MVERPTIADARQSLNAHAAAKGTEIFEKYGPRIGWEELEQILGDQACVRYPCEVVFDSSPLLAGEAAFPVPKGERPEDGFMVCVHPFFKNHLDRVPYLVLYQLVLVIYGEFASPEDAEAFGSKALGLTQETYYQQLCELTDQLSGAADALGDTRRAEPLKSSTTFNFCSDEAKGKRSQCCDHAQWKSVSCSSGTNLPPPVETKSRISSNT